MSTVTATWSAGRRPGRLGTGSGTAAQPAAALVALAVLAWGLSDGAWPAAPVLAIGAILAGALLLGALALLAGHPAIQRHLHGAAAFAALIVIAHALPEGVNAQWLPDQTVTLGQIDWAVSPLWIVALVLGLGLIARPRPVIAANPRSFTAAIAALAALLVLLWGLSVAYWFPWHAAVRPDSGTAVAALRPLVELLSLALVVAAGPGAPALRRVASPVLLAVVLAILAVRLAWPPGYGLWPLWTFWASAAALGAGLLAMTTRQGLGASRARALTERVNELTRTRTGALDVQATELRRIERDLHDGAQVRLVALSMKLGRAEARYLAGSEDVDVPALLREAREDANAAIRELRELARGIAPPVLANRGLTAAARSLAQRSGLEVTVQSTLARRLAPAVETAAYFVVAESLANAAKHAHGARVEIGLHERGGDLCVEITDFGDGGADPAGSGLSGLRQRAEALDGTLQVVSPAGVGTHIEAVLPCGR